MAMPEGTSPSAGVVVIHDVYGASPFYEDVASRLAAAGYAALLPDLFFRQGPLADRSREQARERRSRFDEVQALEDLVASIGVVSANAGFGPVASIGFCMGGTFALDLAALQPSPLTVCYYGFPAINDSPRLRPAPAPLDIVDQLQGPILGFWGDQDTGVGLENVQAFDDALTARSVEHEFLIYPAVGHGFMAASEFDPAHDAYEASIDAWGRTLSFLSQHLS
jgi:carboxymethylenebutenolidase